MPGHEAGRGRKSAQQGCKALAVLGKAPGAPRQGHWGRSELNGAVVRSARAVHLAGEGALSACRGWVFPWGAFARVF